MNQDQNYLTIEMSFRMQLKDHRMVFGAKNLWIVSAIMIIIKILVWLTMR